ncbi:unnamed protein product [Staurois parvus]|uniref:Uncharacterized protein n=1 Tax=Staurois parvus TaxID=386267 RepID=A0ABN9CKE6_9NEOB|nr:unnamed protein product [Staurois parvus]
MHSPKKKKKKKHKQTSLAIHTELSMCRRNTGLVSSAWTFEQEEGQRNQDQITFYTMQRTKPLGSTVSNILYCI